MPNWAYLIVSFVYDLGLAISIGGSLALGALAAPSLFSRLERAEAGALFGTMLRKFARVRLVAAIMVVLAAAVKHFVWESHSAGSASPPWIAIRWVAIAIVTLQVAYEILVQERAMDRAREQLGANPESRAEFSTLHSRAEILMKVSLAAGMVALFFN